MAAELMAKEREMDALASQLASMEQMGGLSLGPHLRQMLAGRGAAVAPPEVKQCLEVAEQHKADGNALFEAGDDQRPATEQIKCTQCHAMGQPGAHCPSSSP